MVTLGQNPILGVVVGAVITVLIQASSANDFARPLMQVVPTPKVHYQFFSNNPNRDHRSS